MAKTKAEKAAEDSAPRQEITINVAEFKRTRDALTTAWINLSSAIDKAVKAYIEHTDRVMVGNATLNTSQLLQPFELLGPQLTGAMGSLSNTAATPAPDAGTAKSKKDKKEKKEKKKPRDPDAPKRPLTAYFRYLNEIRPILLAEGEGKLSPKEVATKATQMWNDMTSDEQQAYKDAYLTEVGPYKEAVTAYKAAHGGPADIDLDEEDDDVFDEAQAELPAPAPAPSAKSAKPVKAPAKAPAKVTDDTDDSDTSTDSDDEPAPPPPPPAAVKKTKATSPDSVLKTPKSAKKAPVPMFNSINPPSVVPASSTKKRKSEVGVEGSTKKEKKHKKSRPSEV